MGETAGTYIFKFVIILVNFKMAWNHSIFLMGLLTARRDLTHTFLLFHFQLTIWMCSIVAFQDWSEIGIFMIFMVDEILRTMNMVLRGDNLVLRLLLERQDHAICAHGLAQSKKDLPVDKAQPPEGRKPVLGWS